MNMLKIACVIVTYNRKELLKQCLDAVMSQTYKPHTVYITDNASTDGTIDSVKEWGYYNREKSCIRFKYILNSKNEGGAGGFYVGMKTAHEEGLYDGLWVMDDDGIPDKMCLENLIPYLENYHFISPLVVAKECNNQMAFFDMKVSNFVTQADNGIIHGEANPFNGVLFSKKLIEDIGYPKKEMFIWGDEKNYMLRATKSGKELIIATNAIHVHPRNRQKTKKILLGNSVIEVDSKWKLFCLIRNSVYNRSLMSEQKLRVVGYCIKLLILYSYYSTIKNKITWIPMILDAISKGYNADFTGLEKYNK